MVSYMYLPCSQDWAFMKLINLVFITLRVSNSFFSLVPLISIRVDKVENMENYGQEVYPEKNFVCSYFLVESCGFHMAPN